MELKLLLNNKELLDEEKISYLQNNNSNIYEEIKELQDKISLLLEKVKKNKLDIYKSCKHDFKIEERVYGERPNYFCMKCGYNP